MNSTVRALMLVIAVVEAMLALGYYQQWSWVTGLWPWPDSRLSYVFLAGISGANAAISLWVALARDLSALRAAVLDALIVSLSLIPLYLVVGIRDDTSRPLVAAIAMAIVSLALAVLLVRLYRQPYQDRRPTPRFLRASFAFFTLALLGVSGALLLRAQNIFPWPLKPESSIAFGLIFIGSAVFYGYAVLRPVMSNAYPQMVAFLAYDLILIEPFIKHFSAVTPSRQLSLILYTAVLVYSGLVTAYYLFIDPGRRLGRQSATGLEGAPRST